MRGIPRPLRYVIEALFIYLAYTVLGELNREFTPPPTGISPIWLPAGFATGVILTRGWWTAIPLFLTGFVNTIRADMTLTDPVASGGMDLGWATVLWAATLYGFAVAGHAVVARLLVDRIPDRNFDGVVSATAFLLAVGPISCVVSAALGTEVFRVEGFVTADTFMVSAFTFWIGDSIACMLIAPVFVAMLGGAAWASRRAAIVVLALATTAIVVTSTALVGAIELDRIEQTFERSTGRAAALLEARARRLEGLAIDQATLLGTAPDLDADTFDAAAGGALERSSGADLLGFVETPGGSIDAARVEFATGEGADDFRASFVPEPIVRQLSSARDDGAARWIPAGDDPGAVDDFVYVPVYEDVVGRDDLTLDERREQLTGFTVVRTNLQQALEDATDTVIDTRSSAVLRSERGDGEPIVLGSLPTPSANPLVDDDLAPLAAARTKGVPFASTRTFELGTEPWSVTFAPSQSFVTDRAFLVTVLPASMIAMALTLTIGILALVSTGQRARLERLVQRRTRSLEASEHRYRSVVDNVRESIFQLDASDRITFTNAAWKDPGDGGSGAVGGPITTMLGVADADRFHQLIKDARAHRGSTVRGEFESIDHEHVFEVRLAAPAIDDDPEGADDPVVGMVVDITEQRAELRNRERFVSLVAHELRNPLAVISGSVSTVSQHEQPLLPPLAAKLFPAVITSARKLDRIIADLLVSSQVDAGTLTLVRERSDVLELVRRSIELARMSAGETRVELDEVDADGDYVVTCDTDRISQVVDNLLSNALKYTPGAGEVRVGVLRDPRTRELLVQVTDSGIGVAAEDQTLIFERWGRTTQGAIVAHGTGLGLSISRSIAIAHGGSLDVESELGIGSTFTLRLPGD